MWMGSGMTPMMFPGVQHYMSRMSMAMGPPALPSMHMAPPQQHRVPVVEHQAAAAPMIVGPTGDHQAFNPLNYQNHQMQGASFPDQYARFVGFHPMQTHVSQVCIMYVCFLAAAVTESEIFFRIRTAVVIYFLVKYNNNLYFSVGRD